MKKPKKVFSLTLLFLMFLCCSCVLTPEKNIDSVYVMVYDYDNNEVMNVSIVVDGVEKGATDIYGRLIFTPDEEKECVIRAEKDGYEACEMRTYIRPGQLIYFKLGTGWYYARRAELLLDENDAETALEMIDAALRICDRKDWQFLRNVILRRLSDEK